MTHPRLLTLAAIGLLLTPGCQKQVVDFDGDGDSDEIDCAPDDAAIHHDATEDCYDEVDNDCDGDVDTYDSDCHDLDGDGYGSDVDCDDDNYDVNPGAEEDCMDDIDNDCDGDAENFETD